MLRLLFLLPVVHAFSNGAGSCEWGGVQHGVPAQPGDGGFSAWIEAPKLLLVPGAQLTAHLRGASPYKGFSAFLTVDDLIVNLWSNVSGTRVQRHARCPHLMTHTKLHRDGWGEDELYFFGLEKEAQQVTLWVTFVESYGKWYTLKTSYIRSAHEGFALVKAPTAPVPSTPTRDDARVLHGICMTLAFAGFIPTTAHIAVIKESPKWFQLHKIFAGIAIGLVFLGICIQWKHGFRSRHAAVGITTCILLILHVVFAIVRPNKQNLKPRTRWRRIHAKTARLIQALGFASLALGVEHATRRDRSDIIAWIAFIGIVLEMHVLLRFGTQPKRLPLTEKRA